MLSPSSNRVKAIKHRFETLSEESARHEKVTRKQSAPLLTHNRLNNLSQSRGNVGRKLPFRQTASHDGVKPEQKSLLPTDANLKLRSDDIPSSESDEETPAKANVSYLYSRVDDSNRSLSRQSSDPGKKLHRSHAFRCDRSQKIGQSPKRHSSCNGRAEMNETPTLKIGEKPVAPRLSRDRLKRLGHLLEDRMRKENFAASSTSNDKGLMPVQNDSSLFRLLPKSEHCRLDAQEMISNGDESPVPSIPDERVPKHILDQYSKVLKPKKPHSPDSPTEVRLKHELLTDSGVSSETENSQENEAIEKTGRLKKLRAHFENANMIVNIKTEEIVAVQNQDDSDKNINNKENLLKTNLEIVSDISSSTETIRRIERKNPNIVLTDTLKKALKQPLPPGPPPKKPPRTFAVGGDSAPSSPEFSPRPERKKHNQSNDSVEPTNPKKPKKDSKQMLEALERALQKHNDSKIIIPRTNHNIYDIAETDASDTSVVNEIPVQNPKRKEIHYLCTEILDIAQRSLLPNSTGDSSNSISNCFNSLNCSIVPTGSSTSIAYAKLNSSGNSSRSSLSNVCCACNASSTENLNDIPENRNKFSTFFSTKPDETLCKKCGANLRKEESFRCHLSCKCKDTAETKSTFFVADDPEHIYAEPYHYQKDSVDGVSGEVKVGEKSIPHGGDVITKGEGGLVRNIRKQWEGETVCDGENSYGAVNNGLVKSLENISLGEEHKIYDVPCHPSRSPSPEIFTSSPKAAQNFDSLRRGFETFAGHQKPLPKSKSFESPAEKPAPRLRNSPGSLDLKAHPEDSASLNAKTSPEIAPKPSLDAGAPPGFCVGPNLSRFKLVPSKSSENLSKELGQVQRSLERKFATEGAKRGRFERRSPASHATVGLTAQRRCLDKKKDQQQLDVDRENLNRLMNEINETVAAHCDMETVSRFPVDADCSGSDDSVKLSRSLTDKRRNYVRRVSSRVAYLEPQTRQNVRFRHQTSICSYKSENLQDHGTYATFRSWKSFKNSQILSKSTVSVNNSAEAKIDRFNSDSVDSRTNVIDPPVNPSKRDSVDSKANLTDSRGNLLRDDFDSADLDAAVYEDTGVDETAGCLDIDRPPEAREKGLFDVCLLVGLNHMTGQAYVKSVFPKNVTVPPHIENLVFPETISADGGRQESRLHYDLDAANTQRYSLVLTNERGERSFGYCRRVLPEGATFCLPLAYCMISRFRAAGFYYKVLQELESHHGASDAVIDSYLQQLFEKDFPGPGETITLTQVRTPKKRPDELRKNSFYRNSVNLGDILKCKTLPDPKKSPIKTDYSSSEMLLEKCQRSEIPEYYDIENNNRPQLSLPAEDKVCVEVKVIKRPIEPRMDEDNLSVLFDSISVNLLIKIFGTLLLERKVVLISDKLSQLSSCVEALQSLLYPLVWQQPLLSTIPAELRRDMLEAPLPMLAGLLRGGGGDEAWETRLQSVQFEEGMLIDLSSKSGAKVIFEQGDESTIIPSACAKTLKASLQLESSKHLVGGERDVEKARNVLISEAFLRFFVDVLAEFWQHFKYARRKRDEWEEGREATDEEEEVVVFEKEQFVKSSPSKPIQYFLEWFTETAMFNHFVQNMRRCYPHRRDMAPLDFAAVTGLVDAPAPGFYEVFDERVTRRHLTAGGGGARRPGKERCVKSAVNRRVKLLKSKLRDLVN